MTLATGSPRPTAISNGSASARLPTPRNRGGEPRPWLWRSAGILVVLAALELIPRTGLLQPAENYPPLSSVIGRGAELLQYVEFWLWLGGTLFSVAVGFAAAFAIGLLLGLAVASSTWLYRASITTFDFLRSVPPVALVPVIVLLLPVGLLSQTLLSAYSTLWVIFFQVVYGRRSIDATLWDTGAILAFDRVERFRYVIWPSLLPSLATGARIGVSVSLALAIVAGLVMGGPNLGNYLNLLRSANDVRGSYALIFLIGFIGLGLNALVQLGERRLLAWHVSVRGGRA